MVDFSMVHSIVAHRAYFTFCVLLLVISSRHVSLLNALHEKHCTSDADVIRNITAKYSKVKTPGNGGVEIEVECWVQEVTSLSDTTSDVQLDLSMSELWVDPALHYEHLKPCKHNMTVNYELLDHIWTPNSCFVNSKRANIHESPFKNIFFMLYQNAFPFDTILCHFTYESFTYNVEDVRLKWSVSGAQKMREKMEIADYELIEIRTAKKEVQFPAGVWHDLEMIFEFKRRYGWYILQAYLPTCLQICVSWISFALGTNGNVISNLPRVNYVKAIDVWMLTCMSFVFCSLLELACVGYITGVLNLSNVRPPLAVAFEQCKRIALMLLGSTLYSSSAATEKRPRHAPTYGQSGPVLKLHQTEWSDREGDKGTPWLEMSASLPRFCKFRDGYEYRPPGMGMYLVEKCGQNSERRLQLTCVAKQLNEEREAPTLMKAKPMSTSAAEAQRLALRLDRLSATIFPSLFASFNVLYWWYYLG